MFTVDELALPGLYEVTPRKFRDTRGLFVKTFHSDQFAEHGLPVDWREEYYSISRCGVLRGLHFQTPPHQHAKMVYCISGEILDAVVDMRVGSPMCGRYVLRTLSAEQGNILIIPEGCAHGFYAVSEQATLVYKVSSVYMPSNDHGVHWNSAGIPWPDPTPLVSERDAAFPTLSNYCSPFVFAGTHP